MSVPSSPVRVAADPLAEFKAKQRAIWASGNFGVTAAWTTFAAGNLVRVAGIRPGERVLDVGTGTGVVAVTAARAGANVTGLDLTPELLEQARGNAGLAGVDVAWREGDAEALPYGDASFDVVLSQFGHMFAPRPDVTAREMLRVLKPGGRIAFSTWPADHLVGRLFALGARYTPPPPGVTPPTAWGDAGFIRERLGAHVRDLHFEHAVMPWSALSVAHYRAFHQTHTGAFVRMVQNLSKTPERLAEYNAAFDAIAAPYFDQNAVRHEYLVSRATKLG